MWIFWTTVYLSSYQVNPHLFYYLVSNKSKKSKIRNKQTTKLLTGQTYLRVANDVGTFHESGQTALKTL